MTPDQAALQHQQFAAFPTIQHPIGHVEEDGSISIDRVWYYFLRNLWIQSGKQIGQVAAQAFLSQLTGGGSAISILNSLTGTVLGQILTSGASGGAAQPQILAASPFVFVATTAGLLTAMSTQATGDGPPPGYKIHETYVVVEISRDSGTTYFLASLRGGAFHVRAGDKVRVTWNTSTTPAVTFFPD